ncbi:MAG: hypothetical protein ACLQOO_07270 [Terriglobia bacterium]
MTAAELRDHRLACVYDRLEKLRKRCLLIRLYPKDPDPYLDFRISSLLQGEVTFQKLSSQQLLTIDLLKVASITERSDGKIVDIELRGRVVWDGSQQGWVFMSRAAALLHHSR